MCGVDVYRGACSARSEGFLNGAAGRNDEECAGFCWLFVYAFFSYQ
jgi:hypothetical protein